MRHLNKIASVFCAAALGMMALTSCEGGDLFSVNANSTGIRPSKVLTEPSISALTEH